MRIVVCVWIRTHCLRLHQMQISTIKYADLNDKRDADADLKRSEMLISTINYVELEDQTCTIFDSLCKRLKMHTDAIENEEKNKENTTEN